MAAVVPHNKWAEQWDYDSSLPRISESELKNMVSDGRGVVCIFI
jgi:hypothetical protein